MLHASGFQRYCNDDKIYDAKNHKVTSADVDFIDIPPAELFGGSSNPAPVEKKEWIEGAGKNTPDADNSNLNINRISGTGTDPGRAVLMASP
jgi:protein TonB